MIFAGASGHFPIRTFFGQRIEEEGVGNPSQFLESSKCGTGLGFLHRSEPHYRLLTARDDDLLAGFGARYQL